MGIRGTVIKLASGEVNVCVSWAYETDGLVMKSRKGVS